MDTTDSPEARIREIGWVAREARALLTDPDPERRARFMERKRALLDVLEDEGLPIGPRT